MKLTVYGSSACSACKTFLQMAKAQGHDPEYLLVDQDAAVAAKFHALNKPGRDLPVVVADEGKNQILTSGLFAGMALLKTLKKESTNV